MTTAVREFHRAWGDPTPLHRIGGGIYIKDESRRFGLNAYKVLGASWALHRLGVTSGMIATATSGNHGRGVAHAARKLGLDCVVYIAASANPVRVARIEGEGARIVRVEGNYDESVRRCIADSRANGWHLVQDLVKSDYREIPEWIIEGYSTLFAEIDERMPERPASVVLHMGAGNFAEAGLRHYRGTGARIAVAHPEASNRTMDCLTLDEPSEGLLQQGVDEWIEITDDDARRAVEFLAFHGIGASPSGAGGVAGLLKSDPPLPAVAVITEGPVD